MEDTCQRRNAGVDIAVGSTVGLLFSVGLMVYGQIRACNKHTFSFSWMMSSYESTGDCAVVTIVALLIMVISAQVLVITACVCGLIVYAEQPAVREGAISPVRVAQVGIVASIVTAFAINAVILFPAYGRLCVVSLSEMSPMMLAWHEAAVGVFFGAVGVSVTCAGFVMRAVWYREHHRAAVQPSAVPASVHHSLKLLQSATAMQRFAFPYGYCTLFWFLVSEVMDGTMFSTERREPNTGKWEVVFMAIVALAFLTLAVQLYHSRTYVHAISAF